MMSIDPKVFRHILSHYPTGVCVVTALSEGGAPVGMAVGSFTSASLDPPLVAFLPDKSSRTWPLIAASGRFCINVLADDQIELCRRFASSAPDKFAGVSHRVSEAGLPILDDIIAWIDCTLHAVHEAGDHHIVLGLVNALDTGREGKPLLFFQGGYGSFAQLEH